MLAAYAKFIREKYTVVIISTLALGIVVGLFTPAPGTAIRKISSFLIIIMIGAMGFTITFKGLGTAARDWKSFFCRLADKHKALTKREEHSHHLLFGDEKPAHRRGDRGDELQGPGHVAYCRGLCLPDAHGRSLLPAFPEDTS